MKVLVADDSDTARRMLGGLVKRLGLDAEVIEVANGNDALSALLEPDGPRLALIDWEMPGLSGVEVCRAVRSASQTVRPFLVLVTARESHEDTVEALKAGADDYITKPPHAGELMARMQVGLRNLELQRDLQTRILQLETAVRQLDVASAVLAQQPISSAGNNALLTSGALGPPLASLAVFKRLPEKFSRLLGGMGLDGAAEAGSGLWAHAALGLPDQSTWLDFTLECSVSAATRMLSAMHGRDPTGEAELLNTVGDVLALMVNELVHGLESEGARCLRPFPPKAKLGTPSLPPGSRALALTGPGTCLSLFPFESKPQRTPFDALKGGQVLLEPLRPPSMPTVEVLAKGCILKQSYLVRTKAFFPGAAASTEVAVMVASPFSTSRD